MRRGWIASVFLLALLARLAYVAAGVEVPAQDTPDYDEIALNMLAGKGFVASDNWFGHSLRSWRAPLYPVMLSGVYAVFGYHHLAVKLVQALLGALSAVLVMQVGYRMHRPSAAVAGFIIALYPPLVASVNEVMTETLFVTLLVAAAWQALGSIPESRGASGPRDYDASASDGHRPLVDGAAVHQSPAHESPAYDPPASGLPISHLLLAGMLVGLATLTRPVGLLLAPALLLPSWWRAWRQGAGGRHRWPLRCSVLLVGGVLLSLAPWTLRNAVVHHALVPVSTHGGFILARSNAADPDWRRPDGWGIRAQIFQQIPNEVERDRYWRQQGWRWIADHPMDWVKLVAERFLRLWYIFRPDFNIGFVLLIPWVLIGLVRYGTTPAYRELTVFIVLSVLVFSSVLYGSTRFRLPLEPFFVLYAAPVAWQVWHSTHRHRWLGLAGGWLSLQLLIWWQQDAVRGLLLHALQAGGLK